MGNRQKKGDRFSFSILLIDKANDYLPHVIYSVNLMGRDGIGSWTRQGLGRFQLDRATVDEETIYNRKVGKIRQPQNNKKLILAEPATTVIGLDVSLITPLRFKHRNRYRDELPFDLLMLMGGLTGKIRFQGELDEFLPFLNYCEIVHHN